MINIGSFLSPKHIKDQNLATGNISYGPYHLDRIILSELPSNCLSDGLVRVNLLVESIFDILKTWVHDEGELKVQGDLVQFMIFLNSWDKTGRLVRVSPWSHSRDGLTLQYQ